MNNRPPCFIDGPHGRIAYRARAGGGPGLVWLGGFRSDMLGSKASFLDEWTKQQGRALLRFDYSGHGASDGNFEDGCISEWAADAITAFDTLTKGPQILIGSSMGAWITTLLARQHRERIAAVIFIAPAPDFTETLMWPSFSEEQRQTIMRDGRLEQASDYSDQPEVITQKLIEDGRKNLVLGGAIPLQCPVRILQGMKDTSVPYAHALQFAQAIESDDVEIILTKNGDHSLSQPPDLDRLARILERF